MKSLAVFIFAGAILASYGHADTVYLVDDMGPIYDNSSEVVAQADAIVRVHVNTIVPAKIDSVCGFVLEANIKDAIKGSPAENVKILLGDRNCLGLLGVAVGSDYLMAIRSRAKKWSNRVSDLFSKLPHLENGQLEKFESKASYEYYVSYISMPYIFKFSEVASSTFGGDWLEVKDLTKSSYPCNRLGAEEEKYRYLDRRKIGDVDVVQWSGYRTILVSLIEMQTHFFYRSGELPDC